MRMGQGVRTGLGHGGITCVLQTLFSSFYKKKLLCDSLFTFLTKEAAPKCLPRGANNFL